ncbi:MAG: flavoprotein, partial [Micrococcales bacterium]|nr:flavoprotein [Micrococcales bacterium]
MTPTADTPAVTTLPVAVVGAGPVVRGWGHVRVFSRWAELVDPAARRLLETTGWVAPEPESYPTGLAWVREYLQPLADALGERVRFDRSVTGVARRGRDRVVDSGRAEQPLTVHTRASDGREGRVAVRAVLDASGTVGHPNPLGSDGYPADGEAAASDRVAYRVPD